MWGVAKGLGVPIDVEITEIRDIPHSISYVIRKRSQIDNLNELPKEKRPPTKLLWDAPVEELEIWLENVLSGKQVKTTNIAIDESQIEG